MGTKFSRNGLKALTVIEGVLLLILAAAFAILLIKHNKVVKANAEPDVRVRPYIEKEETFYQLDGRKILMHDSTMGETFIPAYADVPVNDITAQDIKKDSKGYISYIGRGGYPSFVGIDISEHQGEIDWAAVKTAGIDFAMIRAGYRTYGGGIITMDTNLDINLAGAEEAGIDTGIYFFSQATNTDEAIAEADAVLDAIQPYDITYPVVFDWELIYDDHARTDTVTVETLADCCVAFCERIKSAGYTPMIYQNTSAATHKLDLPRVKDYDFWLADYSSFPTFYYKYDMWQYSSTGKVEGIEGAVDLNVCFKDYKNKPENTAE